MTLKGLLIVTPDLEPTLVYGPQMVRTPDLGAILRVEQENRMSQERGCGRGQWGEKLTGRCHNYSFQFFLPM